MNAEKFNSDYEYYKNNLSSKLDANTVNLMLHAFCMGYVQLAGHLLEEFGSAIDVNPALDKINQLNPVITHNFNVS